MKYCYIYSILITIITTLQLNQNVGIVTPINTNQPQQNYQIYKNQYFSHQCKFVNYQISANIYQAQSSSSNILDDYAKNFEKYNISKTCKIQRSKINMDQIFKFQKLDNRIESSYHSKLNDSYIYVISGFKLILFEIQKLDDFKILLVDEFTLNSDFVSSNSKFAFFNNNLYVSNGFQTYLIELINKSTVIRLNVTNIVGYVPINSYQVVNKLLPINSTHLLQITTDRNRLYAFHDKITWKKNIFTLALDSLSTHNFVDAFIAEDGKIYFLEKMTGVYIFNGLDDKVPIFYNFSYGENIKFSVIANTIQIIFGYNKFVYVAELIKDKNQYSLNRFYDQISGFRDVQFFDNKAIFIGEDSIMIIGHSLNRNLLLNISKAQNKQIFGLFGRLSFQFLPKLSQNNSFVFGVIGTFSIVLIKITQNYPTVTCNFAGSQFGTKSYLVEFNTSHCESFIFNQWQKYTINYTGTYCTIRQGLSIQIKRPFERKASLLFSITVIFVIVVGIFLIIGYAAKWKNHMNNIMKKIQTQIKKRRASSTSTHGIQAA